MLIQPIARQRDGFCWHEFEVNITSVFWRSICMNSFRPFLRCCIRALVCCSLMHYCGRPPRLAWPLAQSPPHCMTTVVLMQQAWCTSVQKLLRADIEMNFRSPCCSCLAACGQSSGWGGLLGGSTFVPNSCTHSNHWPKSEAADLPEACRAQLGAPLGCPHSESGEADMTVYLR